MAAMRSRVPRPRLAAGVRVSVRVSVRVRVRAGCVMRGRRPSVSGTLGDGPGHSGAGRDRVPLSLTAPSAYKRQGHRRHRDAVPVSAVEPVPRPRVGAMAASGGSGRARRLGSGRAGAAARDVPRWLAVALGRRRERRGRRSRAAGRAVASGRGRSRLAPSRRGDQPGEELLTMRASNQAETERRPSPSRPAASSTWRTAPSAGYSPVNGPLPTKCRAMCDSVLMAVRPPPQ